MFDHVGVAVSDLSVSERFYRTVLSVLGVEPSHADAELVEWEDWAIGPTDREHPVTHGLHVGFRAPDRAAVDAFWQAGIDAGHPDDGAPGPRTIYGSDYYGGFLLDPDGNSVEAVHGNRDRTVPDGSIDHLRFRVRDPQASRRFYTTIAPQGGLRPAHGVGLALRVTTALGAVAGVPRSASATGAARTGRWRPSACSARRGPPMPGPCAAPVARPR